METIMNLAAQLGKAIKEQNIYKKFSEAKKAFDANEKLNDKIVEYGVQQTAYQEAAVSPERDDADLEQIQGRLNALYEEIFADPDFVALNAAQEEVNNLMNMVNETITFNITGEQSCTHDCSTCGGCH